MPAIKVFGRRWLAASDDLVLPCIFESLWRLTLLIFMSIAFQRYWMFLTADVVMSDDLAIENNTLAMTSEHNMTCHYRDALFVKLFFASVTGILALTLPVTILMAYFSSRGGITDTKARQNVVPLLYLKMFLILPEAGINVCGTVWFFTGYIPCHNEADVCANMLIEAHFICYWIFFWLTIAAIFIAYDPLGAKKYRTLREDDNGNTMNDIMYRKVAKLWHRRFRFAFCCVRKSEFGEEAFSQCAELFSHLFQGTDMVPSDMLAGSILLRIHQKREQRELQRSQMVNNSAPKYYTELSQVFSPECPEWMTLRNAQHFLRFAVSSYGWPMVCALTPFVGCFGLMKRVTCCACMRRKPQQVVDDNCCNCHAAGTRYAARITNDDIIYASFTNDVFEIPFCILVDNSSKSVVLTIRGSWSLSDVFTDLAAIPRPFKAQGFPENTVAHHGMSICAEKIYTRLTENGLLDSALNQFPEYEFVLTGHSLGAGLAILVGAKLRPMYPQLKVYAFATPSGLLSEEAVKYTEEFVMTLVVGDDCMARASVDSIENLKNGILETMRACKMPKYRVILKGFKYAITGIPSKDLEKPWYDETGSRQNIIPTISQNVTEANRLFQSPRRNLCIAGRILHIVRTKKKAESGQCSRKGRFEMRWATPEDFSDMKVMPRMLLDHFPQNIMKVLKTILLEHNSDSILSVDKI